MSWFLRGHQSPARAFSYPSKLLQTAQLPVSSSSSASLWESPIHPAPTAAEGPSAYMEHTAADITRPLCLLARVIHFILTNFFSSITDVKIKIPRRLFLSFPSARLKVCVQESCFFFYQKLALSYYILLFYLVVLSQERKDYQYIHTGNAETHHGTLSFSFQFKLRRDDFRVTAVNQSTNQLIMVYN